VHDRMSRRAQCYAKPGASKRYTEDSRRHLREREERRAMAAVPNEMKAHMPVIEAYEKAAPGSRKLDRRSIVEEMMPYARAASLEGESPLAYRFRTRLAKNEHGKAKKQGELFVASTNGCKKCRENTIDKDDHHTLHALLCPNRKHVVDAMKNLIGGLIASLERVAAETRARAALAAAPAETPAVMCARATPAPTVPAAPAEEEYLLTADAFDVMPAPVPNVHGPACAAPAGAHEDRGGAAQHPAGALAAPQPVPRVEASFLAGVPPVGASFLAGAPAAAPAALPSTGVTTAPSLADASQLAHMLATAVQHQAQAACSQTQILLLLDSLQANQLSLQQNQLSLQQCLQQAAFTRQLDQQQALGQTAVAAVAPSMPAAALALEAGPARAPAATPAAAQSPPAAVIQQQQPMPVSRHPSAQPLAAGGGPSNLIQQRIDPQPLEASAAVDAHDVAALDAQIADVAAALRKRLDARRMRLTETVLAVEGKRCPVPSLWLHWLRSRRGPNIRQPLHELARAPMSCSVTGRIFRPDVHVFMAIGVDSIHLDWYEHPEWLPTDADGNRRVPCWRCLHAGEPMARCLRTVSLGTCFDPTEGQPKPPRIYVDDDGVHHPFTTGRTKCVACSLAFDHIQLECIRLMPALLVEQLRVDVLSLDSQSSSIVVSSGITSSGRLKLTSGMGVKNLLEELDEASVQRGLANIRAFVDTGRRWFDGLCSLVDDQHWARLDLEDRRLHAALRAEYLAHMSLDVGPLNIDVEELGKLSAGIFPRGLRKTSLDKHMKRRLAVNLVHRLNELGWRESGTIVRIDFTFALARLLGFTVVLTITGLHGHLLGCIGGKSTKMDEYKAFIQDMRHRVKGAAVLVIDNVPHNAEETKMVQVLKEYFEVIEVIQDWFHVMKHLFEVLNNRHQRWRRCQHLLRQLVLKPVAAQRELVEDRLKAGTISKRAKMGSRTLQINRGDKFTDAQIDELHASGEFYFLFGKYPGAIVASEFNTRAHVEAGWDDFVKAVAEEIQDSERKLRVDEHGKTLVSKDDSSWMSAAKNARKRVLNCIPQSSDVPQWTATGKLDVNGIEVKSSMLGSGFNETWHNHGVSYVKGNNVQHEYGTSLVAEGTVVYNWRIDERCGLGRMPLSRDDWRLREIDFACGHGVLSYGSTSSPRDAATRQLTKRPLFDLPPRPIVKKQVFLHPKLEQNLLPAESRKGVSFRPDLSRADLPSEHRVYLPPTPSLAVPGAAQPTSSPFSELLQPPPQPAAKRRKVTAAGAPQRARGSSPQEGAPAAAPLVQATLAPLLPAGRPRVRAQPVNHYLCTCKALWPTTGRGNPAHDRACARVVNKGTPVAGYVAVMTGAAAEAGRRNMVCRHVKAKNGKPMVEWVEQSL